VLPYSFVSQDFMDVPTEVTDERQASGWQLVMFRLVYMRSLLQAKSLQQQNPNAYVTTKAASFSAYYALR
jgi:hypothetical protein